MKLLIIPGGGDPESTEYKIGFEQLKNKALNKGFSDVFIFKFAGHFSLTGEKSFLNQKQAANVVSNKLLEMEKLATPYMIFARSYGCGVTMKVLLENSLPNLKRIVLWGPAPIVSIYEATVHNKIGIENAKKKKGSYVSDETFQSCEPFEIQLLKYEGKHIVNIGAGTNDKYCKPVYFQFLNDYIGIKNITFTSIVGLEHEVNDNDERYLNFIFGNK